MRTKVKLKNGESLNLVGHRTKGTMAEMDIYDYVVMDSFGVIVGKVEYTDHTAIRGFHRTQRLKQVDNLGNVIIEETW
ncbi:hypothetical protein ACPDXT_003508 [Vibrio cholerae]